MASERKTSSFLEVKRDKTRTRGAHGAADRVLACRRTRQKHVFDARSDAHVEEIQANVWM